MLGSLEELASIPSQSALTVSLGLQYEALGTGQNTGVGDQICAFVPVPMVGNVEILNRAEPMGTKVRFWIGWLEITGLGCNCATTPSTSAVHWGICLAGTDRVIVRLVDTKGFAGSGPG